MIAGAPIVTPGAIDAPRFGTAGAWTAVALCVVATGLAGIRWLRVAQREHYLAGSVTRFAARWWWSDPVNAAAASVAAAAVVGTWFWPPAAFGTAALVAVAPRGLGLRGRTSPLRWTRRLRTLAAVVVVAVAAAVLVGWAIGVTPLVAAAVALGAPLVVDAAALVVAPVERALAGRHVRRAAERLRRVDPTVVGITGSFGKTSTKGHVAQLVGTSRALVASPASFNNRAGLARAVNETLAEGTEVFVAEMGTYGVGEIADLCRWCSPDIAVITAIGPVHLERFGSEARILEAKSEILRTARTVVLPVDDERLGALADRSEADGKVVRRCSAVDRTADVCVERTRSAVTGGESGPAVLAVYLAGQPLAKDVPAPDGVQPTNLACAVAVALALGVDERTVGERLAAVTAADHRLSVARAPSGVVVVDDTYNSNPSGAAAALDALCAAIGRVPGAGSDGAKPGASGAVVRSGRRSVVVTPGMVELGPRQSEENARFAAAVAASVTDLVVVGRTNRHALRSGAARAGSELRVHDVRNREEAVAWVRQHLGPGDAVLYENDLPDHYP